MTVSLKHTFTSAKADGGDATLVQPSNWNAEHTLTCATGKLLGRSSAGTGAVEEITAPSGAIVGTTDTQTLSGKTITGTKETVFTITDGASVDIDPANGGIQTWTLGGSRTPNQVNWASGQSITLMIDDGTAYSITWTALGVVWKTGAGVAPTLNTTGYTVIALWKVGTTIYGARVGDA